MAFRFPPPECDDGLGLPALPPVTPRSHGRCATRGQVVAALKAGFSKSEEPLPLKQWGSCRSLTANLRQQIRYHAFAVPWILPRHHHYDDYGLGACTGGLFKLPVLLERVYGVQMQAIGGSQIRVHHS